MIVEFIGCTGSGKTTLIGQVRRRLARSTRVVTAYELVANRIGLGGVTNPTAQNLIQEVTGLPFFIGSLGRHRAFLAFTIRALARNASISAATINNLRSLERKIGVYEMTQRFERDAVVLVDEGPLQAMHMFAFSAASPSAQDIARFAALLPLPDLVVYAKAPVETLVKRTLQRSDAPREMSSKNEALTESYVRGATALFDRLVQAEGIRDRVLLANNPDSAEQCYDYLSEEITASILNYKSDLVAPGTLSAIHANT